jgi:hypothetical protein
MEMSFFQYPVLKGFKLKSTVKSLLLTGSNTNSLKHSKDTTNHAVMGTIPVMIEPDMKDQNFLDFSYEQNPLDGLCSKRFVLNCKGLKFIYHAVSVNNIVYFFRSSESSKQQM